MIRDEVAVGRLLIDGDGFITDCNVKLAMILRATQADLVGVHVLKITAHADRDRCIGIFHQIREDGVPVTTFPRVIRADRTHAWVKIDVTAPEWPRSGAVRMIVEECAAPDDWIEPAILLTLARGMLRARRARIITFGAGMFSDPAWDLLLASYVAEAEGRVLAMEELDATLGMPPLVITRWMRALSAGRLIAYEDAGGDAPVPTSIRLSANAHEKFEDFLTNMYRDNRALDSAASFLRQPDRDTKD